jgi:glycosyltransferase involved in cell wall biosynthesis
VRAGAGDLPGWLESVRRFADVVVALDDGSTDETAEILASDPLVARVLMAPRRAGSTGWDDAANRTRLLEAAKEVAPDWVLWLDVDERIAPDDATALRGLVDHDALPGVAYGFRVFRMIGDLEHYDRAELWVYRLFAYRPGLRLPERRLHFVPVPVSIPRERWMRTSLRIQHLAGVTAERRRRRFAKYLEADPDVELQRSYDHILDEPDPASVRRWTPRSRDAPLLLGPARPAEVAPLVAGDSADLHGPALSAIVIARDDEARIERAVRSVLEQECPEPFEVIVVVSGSPSTARVVQERFGDAVRLVELERPALPGAARNAGLRVARGEFVSFPGSHVELSPGSLAARLKAHRAGNAMVTGSMLNGTRTRAGWASYFLDHSTCLPGRPSGPLSNPPVHCSYMRHHVAAGFPEDLRAGEDTVVNNRLFALGYRAFRERDIALWHHSRCTTAGRLLSHHFARGRALARITLADLDGGRPAGPTLGNLLVRYLPRRLRATRANVHAWGDGLRRPWRAALPLVVAGAAAAWGGCWYELARASARGVARRGRGPAPAGVSRGTEDGDADALAPAQAPPDGA